MERKVKTGISAPLIVGIVFGFIGISFLAVGLSLHFYLYDPDAKILSLIFLSLGALFLCLGILFFAIILSQRQQAKRLIAANRYVWGQVTEFVPNVSVTVNGRHPYVAIVRYQDASGIHIFRSRNLYHYPDPSAVGRQVKVYIQNEHFKPYYVDIDAILPQVIEH